MLKPLNNRVVIRPDIEKQTESGILIPDSAAEKERPITGTVVIGNESVKEGNRVVFSKFGFDETEIEGEKLYLVSDFNVLAIIV